jgi:hypothetical protein
LFLVFVPLDYLLKSDRHPWIKYGTVVAVSLTLLATGILIERRCHASASA